MTRAILAAFAVTAVALGGYAWLSAGAAAGPEIDIRQPVRFVGRTAVFEATVESPDGRLTALDAFIEQDGAHPLFALDDAAGTETRQESATRLRLVRRFDRESHPELRAGPATVVVRATRPVLFGLREASSEAAVEVEVRLDPPRLSPLSRFHYVNHGGAEFIVYRVSPADAESGVEVGDRFYPGYDAAGVGNKTLLEYGFFHAVDIFGEIEAVDVCFARDTGTIVLLEPTDAPSPREAGALLAWVVAPVVQLVLMQRLFRSGRWRRLRV